MVVRVKWFYHPEETKGGRKSHDGKVRSLSLDESVYHVQLHSLEKLSFLFK